MYIIILHICLPSYDSGNDNVTATQTVHHITYDLLIFPCIRQCIHSQLTNKIKKKMLYNKIEIVSTPHWYII